MGRKFVTSSPVTDTSSLPPLLLSSLKLSDTQVYEPYKRDLLGAAANFCTVISSEPTDQFASWSTSLQGYLAHKKQRPPWTLQWDYAQGPTVVIGVGGGYF